MSSLINIVKALDDDYSDYFKDSLADAITACSQETYQKYVLSILGSIL